MARTRFAPSPTGMLHIGGVRTALYCYALSKKTQGQFIVRVEDTDQKRFVEGAIEKIFEGLNWVGIKPDESIQDGGDYGPYIQSERKEIYRKYANQLLEQDNAYYCFLEGEELKSLQAEFKGKGFRSPYRNASDDDVKKLIEEGKPYTIRLKVPDDEIIVHKDGLQGEIKFDSNIVGDEILIKSDGMASYHLAVVVDDYLMKISHVFRAIEWLPSTPKQILIHRFLGLEMPPYYHLPVILDPAGGKLSKRNGAVSVEEFANEGYLPETMLNFLMLLGWSAPIKREHGQKEREIFSLSEFIEMFDLKDLNKANPVFNRDKLIWFNKEYIKNMDSELLTNKFLKWLNSFSNADEATKSIINADTALSVKLSLVKDRATTLKDALAQIMFFYNKPSNIDWSLKQLSAVSPQLADIKKDIYALIESMHDDSSTWTHEQWETGMRAIGDKHGAKHGDIFMVLRVAVVGTPFSPQLFECLQVLGKKEVLERLTA